jgi:hypothetical protein
LSCNNVGEYTDGNFWYVVLFGDDVLIIGDTVALFFQGEDFIIGLGMVGRVLASVIGSFLLVAFFPLLLTACWIMVVMFLVVLTILVVLVVAILLVVAVVVVVLIVAMGVVGIYSFWIARVMTFGI